MEAGFFEPTPETRPWVYYYWVRGHMSKTGITRDLEAMARVGIGQVMVGSDIDQGNGAMGPIEIMSDEWWELIDHTMREATRVGMTCGFFNSTGWSQSGGPWNGIDRSMRYITVAESTLTGPQQYSGPLPTPPADFEDVATFAFPAPRSDRQALDSSTANITSDSEIQDLALAFDGDDTTVTYWDAATGIVEIDIRTQTPFTARSLTVLPAPDRFAARCEIFTVDDEGETESVRFFTINHFLVEWGTYAAPQAPFCKSLGEVESTHFRIRLEPLAGERVALSEIRLSSAARLEHYIDKQLLRPVGDTPSWGYFIWPEQVEVSDADLGVSEDDIIRLDDLIADDGTLHWDVPMGDWVVVRTGMAPTYAQNGPAQPIGRGLEVDKMSREAIEHHFNAFTKKILERLPVAERGVFTHVVADSYEMGFQNWTNGFAELFRAQYGYDPIPWLTVLTGRIVNSAEQSDRFLWDLRRLVADLISYNYVGGLREVSNQNGLKLWLENYGHFGFPSEFLQYGGRADQTNGEFWVEGAGEAELTLAVSTAHVYGKPVVGAEGFTSMGQHWRMHPWELKRRGDWAYSKGINHLILHVYIQQPYDDRLPGMNAWFGTEFNRNNTWFELSKGWIDYLRRCHHLLQQGSYVADVAYYIGEDTPKSDGIRDPGLPPGYSFDYVNAEALDLMSVQGSRLNLPGGASYQILVLPPIAKMRPAVLERIIELVGQGATVMGAPPNRSPSLQGYPECDEEVRRLANQLWIDAEGNRFGKGQVLPRSDLGPVLESLGTPPRFSCENPNVLWTHRSAPGFDLYFLSNQEDKENSIQPVFDVVGRVPELWDADDGSMREVGLYTVSGTRTRVPLSLGARESIFVVFRKPARGPHVTAVEASSSNSWLLDSTLRAFVPVVRSDDGILLGEFAAGGVYAFDLSDGRRVNLSVDRIPDPRILDSQWDLRFPAGRDVPTRVRVPQLRSWTEFEEAAIQHFSGTGVYTTNFELAADQVSGVGTEKRLVLDLGDVGVMAKVTVNGEELGILWQSPFDVDITDAVVPGPNTLKVEVANLWVNRRVGDVKYPDGFPGEDGTITPKEFETWIYQDKDLLHFTKGTIQDVYANENLLPSGLIGPVTIRTVRRIPIR